MMNQMRRNTKWIMLATALAFVGLMVFEWGADMSGRSAGGFGEIGSVDGTPVMYEMYNLTYRNLYDQAQASQNIPISNSQNRDIENLAFDTVVDQILIQHELDRRGIIVTEAEISNAARFSPLPQFQASSAFYTNGQFDLQKYQNFLAGQTDEFLLQLEAYYRSDIPQRKLARQLSAGIFVPDQELWRLYKDANEQVAVEYIALNPLVQVPDAEVEVTAAEVERYFRDHEEDFERLAQADVNYAVIEKTITAADSVASIERASEIRQEIVDGSDFADVAARESMDTGSAQFGGELGQVVRGGGFAIELEEAMFDADVGEVLGPVQTAFGLHVFEVTERIAADTLTARHILIPIAQSFDSEIEMLTRADSLESLGEGMTLQDAAANLGLEVTTGQLTEGFPLIAGAGLVQEGFDWAIEEAEPGDVSPVFENEEAFYILEVLSSSERRLQTLEEATPEIRRLLMQDRKIEVAVTQAEQIAAQLQGGAVWEDVAASFGLAVGTSELFNRQQFVPVLGAQNAAIGTAFGLSEGQISAPVATEDNVFVMRQTQWVPADETVWEEQKELQRARVATQVEQLRFQEWLLALRARANIVDRREDVLLDPDELAEMPQAPGFGF